AFPFRIYNLGYDHNLNINSIDVTGPFVVNNVPNEVLPEQYANFNVSVTTILPGVHTGTVVVRTANGGTLTFNVSAQINTAKTLDTSIRLKQVFADATNVLIDNNATASFGAHEKNTQGLVQAFRIFNDGTEPLLLGVAKVSGHNAFWVLDGSALSNPIPVGGQVEFSIKMALNTEGTHNATFKLVDLNDPEVSPLEWNVSGTVAPATPLESFTALKQVLVNATNPLISDGGMASLGTHDQNTSQDHMQVFRVLNSSTEA
ncbi:hypothetical protein, partial [Leptobacterium sp. I13]|uniref:hypothetical protein n=1 Tax=Leptobacterium meishanense TaxID=3128904 RepID=UPI0030EDE61E